uniref:Elongation of very long chain fatty acids protein n=1 Tax=Glossina pallidipes TaxID=7398 RepID=A0A1A9Z3X6_GLOPL
MLLIKVIYWKMLEFEREYCDPRTAHLPLASSLTYTLALTGLYLLTVLKLGPALMSNRKPYEIKRILQIYNVLQIVVNLYIVFQCVTCYLLHPKFNWSCFNTDKTDYSPENMAFLTPSIVGYWLKFSDFLETIFYVLRKKWNQVSFLHVYHHCMVFIGVCIYMKYGFASHFTMVPLVNCFVHTVMYCYYLAASLDLKIDFLPWKRRITQLQILQFLFFAVHTLLALANNWCGLPTFILTILFIQDICIACMFANFYYRAYVVKRRKIENNMKEIKQT